MSREDRHPFWEEVDGTRPLPPAAQHLGMRFVEVEPGSGRALVEFSPRPEFNNPHGQIQGGFLAAMLDDTVGAALATRLAPDEFAVTLESKVSYLRPAALGALVGAGRVVNRGRSLAFLDGELRDADGVVLATASATARVFTRKSVAAKADDA